MPIPALGDRSPREAVRDPAGRATVIRLLKPRLAEADERRLRGQPAADDPEAHVRALGLHELYIPIPPPRPCPPDFSGEDDDYDDDEDDDGPPLTLPPPAILPLTREQALARFDAVCDYYDDDNDLLDAWDDACPGLSDFLYDSLPETFSDDETHLLDVAMALGWAILAGNDKRLLVLNHHLLQKDMVERWIHLETEVHGDRQLDQVLQLVPAHGEIVRLVLGDLLYRLEEMESSPQKLAVLTFAICRLTVLLPAYSMGLNRR